MSFFSGDRFVFELDSKLNEVRRKAIKRAKLNHYTNIDSLLKIFDTKTFKLNSIKNMNDKMEAKYISVDNIEDLVFLSSFCHGKENIPLWLGNVNLINISLTFVSVWRYMGQNMVMFSGCIMTVIRILKMF